MITQSAADEAKGVGPNCLCLVACIGNAHDFFKNGRQLAAGWELAHRKYSSGGRSRS